MALMAILSGMIAVAIVRVGIDLNDDIEDNKQKKQHLLQLWQVHETLRKASGISTDSLFRKAIRVRTVCRSGDPASLESWIMPMMPSSGGTEEHSGGFGGMGVV